MDPIPMPSALLSHIRLCARSKWSWVIGDVRLLYAMPTIVSLLNMKGGVGKSTLAVNLAWQFFQFSKRVLVVDLDPQFNASQYMLGGEGYKKLVQNQAATTWDIFEQHTSIPGATTGGV